MEKNKNYCINQKLIYDYIQQKNLTTYELADKCKIPHKTMDKILSTNTDYPLIYILRIARLIDVPFVEMFKIK